MSWSGAIIGGIIGSIVAGGWGAAIGAAIGSLAGNGEPQQTGNGDRSASDSTQADTSALREAWEALFRSYGRIAKSDGVVSREEADLVTSFLRETDFESLDKKRLIAAFNEGKKSQQSFGRLVTAVKNCFRSDVYADIMRSYCNLVLADGEIDGTELAMLREAEAVLECSGFVDRWLEEVRGERREQRREPPPRESAGSLDWAYRLLGVASQCTDDEVKKAWRAKAKEYHPDVLRGKGVEESVIKLAEVQMRRINDAYAAIKKVRGF